MPRRTITDWISGFRSITTFHRFRSAAILDFSQEMLKERTLEHRQIYQYKVHLAKLALSVDAVPPHVAAKVRSYLLSVFEDFPDALFRDDITTSTSPDRQTGSDDQLSEPAVALRSSASDFETLPLARIEKQNLANDLAPWACFWLAGIRTVILPCKTSCSPTIPARSLARFRFI